MKRETNKPDQLNLQPILGLPDETTRRRNRFSGKKFKGRPDTVHSEDERSVLRPKSKGARDNQSLSEEWDEDDEALYEFRRKGSMVDQE